MLEMRDRILEIETQFSSEEKALLANADRQLVAKAPEFDREISRFINLPGRRNEQAIPRSVGGGIWMS
uniref:Uncharacterized protein n=1 Tax=Desertifilum tharense IPPAS B-1220 TaxID=1781255 RepID=A0ACD5GS71_9CYAN